LHFKFSGRVLAALAHPFASSHYRKPLHPDNKTNDNDLEAIFRRRQWIRREEFDKAFREEINFAKRVDS